MSSSVESGRRRRQLSSSEDQDDEQFDQAYKKVKISGRPFDSHNQDSLDEESQSPISSKPPFRKKSTSSRQQDPQTKSRAIRKNRQSAKISRLRKKQYQEVLEQKGRQLLCQIDERRRNIQAISSGILNKFSVYSKEKHRFLVQKLALSKKLLSISEQLKGLRAQQEQLARKNSENDGIKIQDSLHEQSVPKQEKTKSTKVQRRKIETTADVQRNKLEEAVRDKEELLSVSIKAYMYQFGTRGCLRSDIIQRNKFEWLQNLQDIRPKPSSDTSEGIGKIRLCFERLQRQARLLDFHLRQLRERVKDKYVVQFLLDRQFFMNNSADTIYKNSQLRATSC